ncbi:MAG: hypothetical protein ACM35G_08565 [Planctomycetaceae bacterium]
MPVTKLPLPDGQRTKVFRQVEAFLRNDPVLSRVVRGDAWKDFSGDPNDAARPAPLQAPAIRIYPAPGPMAWATPDSMLAPLYINIECCVAGLVADDVLNLQDAIERAIYPADPVRRRAQVGALQALGAIDGLVEFALPLWDRAADMGRSGHWFPVGQMRIDVRRTLDA